MRKNSINLLIMMLGTAFGLTACGIYTNTYDRNDADDFIIEAETKQVISNTKWQGDESWWISLKQEYDTFFKYEWSIGNLQYSFENAYESLGKKHDKWLEVFCG